MAVLKTATQQQTSAQIGSWALLRDLGEHAGQRLYLVQHNEFGKASLLKLGHSGSSTDQLARKRCSFAARLAACNPGRFLQAHEVFEWKQRLVSVVEWPRGNFLSAEARPVDVGHAVALCHDVACALTTMHDSGAVHGAVGPDAAVVEWGGEAPVTRLLDLGLCLEIGEVPPSWTFATSSLAPENRRGTPVDARTDVFGIGMLGFKLLPGQTWQGRARGWRPPPMASDLEDLLRRCLASDPSARPANVDVVRRELDAIRQDLASSNAVPVHLQETTSEAQPAHGDAAFGAHADWFFEDGANLTEEEAASLFEYAPPRRRLPTFVWCLFATTTVFAAVVVGMEVYT